MKIYGHFFSAPVNQVRLTASALGIKHDYQHIDIPGGETKSAEYLAINPFGRVPALDDNGFKLGESGAISRYLACKNQNNMYPQDAQKRAEIDQWMDVAAHHIRTNMSKILFNKVFAPMMERSVDEQSMADGRTNLATNLPMVNDTLGQTPYLAGDSLTIADTAMMAALDPFEMIEVDLTPYPNINKWRQNNMAQDWYQNVHAHFGAEMQA